MSFDNTKHDLELNGVGVRVKAYQKGDAPTFIPRVGSSGQSESEFNLLLSRTTKSFEGGMLQRFFEDDSSVFGTEGLYPIYDDGVLYPVNQFLDPSAVTALIGKSILTAWVQTRDYVYIAYQSFSAPSNFVKRIDRNGTQQAITLPAGLSASTSQITSMVLWNNQIWFGTSNTANQYYHDTTTTAATMVPAGTGSFYQMVLLKGGLYGTDQGTNAVLHKYTGTTATTGFTEVGNTGKSQQDLTGRLIVYNNRIFLLRKDGMYAYDGVTFQTIEDTSENWDSLNFRWACVLRGYMYYWMPDGLYRYNGSLIEKLYDIQEVGVPVDVCVGKNRMWILYSNTGNSSSVSRYDKAMGYDYSSSNDIQGRVAVFNGKALFTYGRTITFVKNPGTEDFSGQGEVNRIFFYNDSVYVTMNYDKTGSYNKVSLNEVGATGKKPWLIVTSVDDADFAMLKKNLENNEIVLDGTIVTDTITVEYRTAGFEGSSGWTALGTFNTLTELKRYVWKTVPAGVVFKRIQFKFSGTTEAGYGLAKLIMRYSLSPDIKWQWSFTMLNYGDDRTQKLQLADGSESAQAVSLLRGNLYAARASDVPVLFVDIDQLNLSGAINSAVTSVVLDTTSLLKGSEGFIKVEDEIMYYSARTSTTLTVVRGALGSTAASHADDTKAFPLYRVFVSQINPERIILEDNGRQAVQGKSRTSEISVVLREV